MNTGSNVMFVSDLLKTAKPESAPQAVAKSSSVYDRVREEQRRLESEQFNVREMRVKLETLKASLQEPVSRHQIHESIETRKRCEELEKYIETVESGQKLEEFNAKTRPYLQAFQKQQFCRAHDRTASSNSQTQRNSCLTNAVLCDYVVNVEGGIPKYDIVTQDMCTECKEAMQLYQAFSLLVCPRCGRSKPFLDATASLLAYSDEYDYCSFSYKRINHFSEWLASIQAKETLEVPQSILDTIMQHLHDQRIHDLKEVTVHRVRDILKKLKMRKYYEHVQLITCKITGRNPPRMSPEMEEKIKVCFLAASSSFQRHCPPDRKNMISYQLVLLKLCELLGYTEFVPYFMLLKGRDKLSRMDEIWKKICDDLDWTFIPSVP